MNYSIWGSEGLVSWTQTAPQWLPGATHRLPRARTLSSLWALQIQVVQCHSARSRRPWEAGQDVTVEGRCRRGSTGVLGLSGLQGPWSSG